MIQYALCFCPPKGYILSFKLMSLFFQLGTEFSLTMIGVSFSSFRKVTIQKESERDRQCYEWEQAEWILHPVRVFYLILWILALSVWKLYQFNRVFSKSGRKVVLPLGCLQRMGALSPPFYGFTIFCYVYLLPLLPENYSFLLFT